MPPSSAGHGSQDDAKRPPFDYILRRSDPRYFERKNLQTNIMEGSCKINAAQWCFSPPLGKSLNIMEKLKACRNPFTTGNPFLGTKSLGFSIGRGSGALKGLKAQAHNAFFLEFYAFFPQKT